jgi:hypothetical protein
MVARSCLETAAVEAELIALKQLLLSGQAKDITSIQLEHHGHENEEPSA